MPFVSFFHQICNAPFKYNFIFLFLQALMGVFLRINSPAFVDDLPVNDTEWELRNYDQGYIDELYEQLSSNCFIAAGLYVGTLTVSAIMWKVNQRANYNMS